MCMDNVACVPKRTRYFDPEEENIFYITEVNLENSFSCHWSSGLQYSLLQAQECLRPMAVSGFLSFLIINLAVKENSPFGGGTPNLA